MSAPFPSCGRPPCCNHDELISFRNQTPQITRLLLAFGCASLMGCHYLHRGTDARSHNNAPATVNSAKPTARVSVGPGRGTLAGSATPKPPAASIPTATKEIRVGEIRVVGSGRRFVLIEVIQRPDAPELSPGLELRSRSPASDAIGGQQTGTLRVSPERRQPFVVADVISGEPRIDDPVFYSSENQMHLVPAEILPPVLTSPTSSAQRDASTVLHP